MQTTRTKNNLDPVPLAFFCMDCDRLAFASQDEASKSGPTLEDRLLAEMEAWGHCCLRARDDNTAVGVGVAAGLRSQKTILSPLDQIASDLSTTDVR